jgi:hypothetical protein
MASYASLASSLLAVLGLWAGAARAQDVEVAQDPPEVSVTEPVLVPETPAPPPPLEGTASATVPPPPEAGASVGEVAPAPPQVDLPEGEAPPREPEHEHRGFFIRGLPGGGYLEMSRTGLSGRGIALGIGMQVGFAVIENLIVFGELWYRGVASANGEGLTPAATTGSATLNAVAAGVGVGYYIMPINVHVALAFNVAYGELVWDVTIIDGRGGVGAHLLLGKEWYIARQVGLGIAADVALASLEDYLLFKAGLLGTVTFN